MKLLNKTMIALAAIAGAAAFAMAGSSSTIIIPGGGPPKSDCYATLAVTGSKAIKNTKTLECTDGDPTCDQDGVCGNDSCTFQVQRCALTQGLTGCTPPASLESYTAKTSKPKTTPVVPDPSLTGSACGALTDLVVPVNTKPKKHKPGTLRLGATAKAPAGTKPRSDGDSYVLKCLPAPAGSCTSGTTTTTLNVVPPPDCATANPQGGPDQLDLLVTTGSDLDNGWSGVSHNFPVPQGTTVKLCLSGCDDSTNPVCTGTGTTDVGGAGSLNGPNFGPPLPLVAGGIPVCVVNKYAEATISASVANVQTGEFTGSIHLNSEVWTTPAQTVCPKCSGATLNAPGTCNSGARKGQACHTEGIVTVKSDNPPISATVYTLSHDCPPGGIGETKVATLPINLDPLTTAESTMTGPKPCPGQANDDACGAVACDVCPALPPPLKGGVDQYCCQNAQHTPCFPTKANSSTGGMIIRTGVMEAPATPAAWPETTYPKTGAGVGDTGEKLVNVFCIGKTNTNIDTVSGLPGPGALILPVKQCYKKLGQDCLF
jgi:hypothetical protein